MAPETQLSPELLTALQRLQRPRVFAKGKELFRCGDQAEGVYLINSGKVNLLVCASARRPRVFASLHGGAVLGLSESISGDRHKLTAEAGELTRVSFVGRDEFMQYLRNNQEFCLRIVHLLSEDVHYLYGKFRQESKGRAPKGSASRQAS